MLKPALGSLLALLALAAQAEWQNPSEKYADAYRKYLDAACPIRDSSIRHYVYFARDRDSLRGHSLLRDAAFSGAQIMYAWRQLEPEKGVYDFSLVREDYLFLEKHGKKLFIQLQDATFSTHYNAVPDYLQTDEYDGGAIYQHDDNGEPEGWVAKRWNARVLERFARLMEALGKEFDGKVEGINLQETAIGVDNESDPSFTPEAYIAAVKQNMKALKYAFPRSVTMQYANFTPGEWLPWEDKGQLRSLYEYGERQGVGMGAPDLMVRRKGQLNHALTMMHEDTYTVPLGIAVQDGNYIGQTGSNKIQANRENMVPLLHAFAKDFLKVNYIFWSNQQPYFDEDVMPCFSSNQ